MTSRTYQADEACSITREEYEQLIKRKKRQKYNAKPTEIDGYKFASKWEAERYQELRIAQNEGWIAGLMVHPKYPLHGVNGGLIGMFTLDFEYFDKDRRKVIEDTKSGPTRTEAYMLRKRLFEDEYAPLKVTEVMREPRRKKARRAK